jgi:hypothetical protein
MYMAAIGGMHCPPTAAACSIACSTAGCAAGAGICPCIHCWDPSVSSCSAPPVDSNKHPAHNRIATKSARFPWNVSAVIRRRQQEPHP